MALTCSDIFKFIFAIILPPLGYLILSTHTLNNTYRVFLERGCAVDVLINILLTILGFIPGVIHAFYIILKY